MMLEKFEGDSCCSTHCTGRFMCAEDQSRESFCEERPLWMVKLEGDSRCSAHSIYCTLTLCDEDQSWEPFFQCRRTVWWGRRCPAHCTARFMCDGGYNDDGDFLVAGAIFVEVGGWVSLLRALNWTLGVWREQSWEPFFCGRRNLVKLESELDVSCASCRRKAAMYVFPRFTLYVCSKKKVFWFVPKQVQALPKDFLLCFLGCVFFAFCQA